MTLAILADIHGNSAALKAVLDDMDRLGVTEAVHLGDYFSGPLDARGTADLLRTRNDPAILGNHDRWLIDRPRDKMTGWEPGAYDQLTTRDLDWLRSLPATLAQDDIFLCHGTPQSDLTYWLHTLDPSGMIRASTQADIAPHARGIDASLILCGHTHLPRMVRLADDRMIVNPGSVGCPGYSDDQPVPHVVQTGAPHAAYAIATRHNAQWDITFRAVPYDTRPMVALAQARGHDDWARVLATGWIDG